jgi:predicted RND superfamily exporter protein
MKFIMWWRGLSLFGSLSGCSIRHPWPVLAGVAVIVLGAAAGLWRLQLRTDGHALVSESAPEVLYDKGIRDEFGIEDNIVVLIRSNHPGGIFNPGTLQLVRDLTAALAQMPGTQPGQVMSLATEPGFRFRPGTWTIQTLLEPPLKTTAELDQLREDLRRMEIYTGTLVSSDGRSTLLLVSERGADRSRLYEQVLNVVAAQKGAQDQIGVTGEPVAEALLGVQILEDLGVPGKFLGAGARGVADAAQWKWPANLRELRRLTVQRAGLVPMAALVMMLVLLFCFRNLLAALIPLPGVVATILFVFGLMGWCHVPIYLTTAVMPVLLTVLSVTNDIYLFNRYFNLLHENPARNHIDLVGETFDKLVPPIACTSLTAAIGFFSFGFSPLAPVRAFGIFTGIGALFGLFLSLAVVPALLVLINPARLRAGRRGDGKAAVFVPEAWFARLGQMVARRRRLVTGTALGIMALAPLGLARLAVQDSWTNGFDPDSGFRRVTQQVNDSFFGMHRLFVSFDAPQLLTGKAASSDFGPWTLSLPADFVRSAALVKGSSITFTVPAKSQAGDPASAAPGAVWRSQIQMPGWVGDRFILRLSTGNMSTNFRQQLSLAGQAGFEIAARSHVRPEIIQSTGELASFIRQRSGYAVGGVLGPFDYLTTTRFMVRPEDPNARRLPDDADQLSVLWNYYGTVLGEHRLREVVDTSYWRSLTTVFLKDANFADTARLMSDLRQYEREHLTPKGIKIGFAGDVAVSQSLIRAIVTTQMQSLIWSLAGIFAVTALFGGSMRWGFYCLIPSLLAVVVKFAVMGWLGIPLGVATSMFAAMTLGIGVNCAIHLLEGCRQACAAGASPTQALNRSFASTGPPALINTLAMTFGFGVLMLSQVPANARLGLLMVLGLVNCLVASLLILPVILHWWPLEDSRENSAVSPSGEF